MVDEPDNLVLRMLRQVDSKQDILMERFLEMTARMASIEDQLVRNAHRPRAPGTSD